MPYKSRRRMFSDSTEGIHVGNTNNLDFQMGQDLSTGEGSAPTASIFQPEARSAVLPAQASECIGTPSHHLTTHPRKLLCRHLGKMEKEPFLKAKQTQMTTVSNTPPSQPLPAVTMCFFILWCFKAASLFYSFPKTAVSSYCKCI